MKGVWAFVKESGEETCKRWGKLIMSCLLWCLALIHRLQMLSLAGHRVLKIRAEQVDHPVKGHFTGDDTHKQVQSPLNSFDSYKSSKWWCMLHCLLHCFPRSLNVNKCNTSAAPGVLCQYLRNTEQDCLSSAALLHQRSTIIQREICHKRGSDTPASADQNATQPKDQAGGRVVIFSRKTSTITFNSSTYT